MCFKVWITYSYNYSGGIGRGGGSNLGDSGEIKIMTIFNGLLESNCENNFFRDLAE